MNVIGKVTVLPRLPEAIVRLEELAYNMYWSWTPRAQELYSILDEGVWNRFQHNPVRTMLEVSAERLTQVASDPAYLAQYAAVMADFDAYMGKKDTWASQHAAELGQGGNGVAYFSMEYAYHECLPIYSGGLGVLAGDHCKSASDLGLPFTAVGMLFHQGYFTQLFNKDGWQQESYDQLDLTTLPIRLARTPAGDEARVSVRISGREIVLRVWTLQVGRIRVLLLDSNVPENSEDDRKLTARLYGGNQELRIQQYLLLGVGGVRALRVMNVQASVYHMNEGHAAFMVLERIREEVARGQDFRTATEAVAAATLFTTHTPVPAGNDAYPYDLTDKYLGEWPAQLATSRDELYELARQEQYWDNHWVPSFSMSVFALRMSRAANGVSELHGEVSRGLWNFLYQGAEPEEVPIGHVTNGAHNLTFLAQEYRDLFAGVLPSDWTERLEDRGMWEAVRDIPDASLAGTKRRMKVQMIDFVRSSVTRQLERNGASAAEIAATESLLDPDALTIGFARRFATYKRATLLFRDKARLAKIVNDPQRPVQFVFAGKAHPADNPGKAFIQEIYRTAQEPEFRGKIVILENYDMNVARHLVQGVDVWMNNPRRPLEASGTSGMKASFNGAPNFSVLDGWWREGYDGKNGWPIGDEREYADLNLQDDADSFSLYRTLEDDIVPLYYGLDAEGQSHGWLDSVRQAIITVNPEFSMQRQVIDYTQKYYLTLNTRSHAVQANGDALARDIGGWKSWIRQQWPHTSLQASAQLPASVQPGERVSISAQVNPAGINESDLRVEAVLKRGEHIIRVPLESKGQGRYETSIPLDESGLYSIGVRMMPEHEKLSSEFELGLLKWA
ncbi:alpha-glucan family phosphorylase [Deinococcus ruber]|uniref:Alpha-glucan phosphorylase n=1 Tax=Deinococcus ruber TaxID=1848197 RepID=A0A918F2K6_9DEIO|nr:alpha-glucan family phosphorylase [Deinococcus ruber]GGQ98942.1 alpha-glucan phosphorylase [Deinococcus ruber]